MITSHQRAHHFNFNPRSLTGATPLACWFTIRCPYFNPRSLTGATGVGSKQKPQPSQFQSTLPHGSDKYDCISVQAVQHFNPRSLTGATM